MLSMRRCCPDKTLFTFVRVELISFLPFTDCSNCRVVGKMCRTLPIKLRTSVKSLGYKTPWQLFEKKKKKSENQKKRKSSREFSHILLPARCHTCGRTSRQPSPLCVWQGHMLMLTPCGETAGAISVCVCVDVNPWCVCVCAPMHPVCVDVHCVCVCMCGGCQADGDTMKWVAERAPPTIKALNGQPEVPVSVWMRRVLLGG